MLAAWIMAQEARPVHVIIAMLASKAHDAYLAALQAGISDRHMHIHAVPIHGNDNALSPADLAAAAQEVGFPAAVYDNPAAAISAIEDETALIIIAGSLYLAGDVLRDHG